MEGPRVEQADDVFGVVGVEQPVAAPIEDAHGVVDPLPGHLAPGHDAEVAVGLEVVEEERILGGDQPANRDQVRLDDEGDEVTPDLDLEPVVVVEIQEGVEQAGRLEPVRDRGVKLVRFRHAAAEDEPFPGDGEGVVDGGLARLREKSPVELEQVADLEQVFVILGFELERGLEPDLDVATHFRRLPGAGDSGERRIGPPDSPGAAPVARSGPAAAPKPLPGADGEETERPSAWRESCSTRADSARTLASSRARRSGSTRSIPGPEPGGGTGRRVCGGPAGPYRGRER